MTWLQKYTIWQFVLPGSTQMKISVIILELLVPLIRIYLIGLYPDFSGLKIEEHM